MAGAPHGRLVAYHDGKGLLRAVLERAQPLHGFFTRRIAGEVEAADALDGRDAARSEDAAHFLDGSGPSHRLMAKQVDLGAAVVAADGLRIVAAALGRDVLLVAGLAHREFLHARALAVVRHGLEDGQPRAAGRAVDEGVQVAAVVRVEELRAALVARRDVGRDEDVAALLGTLDDGKILVRRGIVIGHIVHVDLENGRALRCLFRDARDELLQ